RELVRRAIGERFRDVLGAYGVRLRERRDRPRDPADACVAATGEVEAVGRPAQERVGLAVPRGRPRAEAFPCGAHSFGHGGRALARRRGELLPAYARQREDEVEAVEKRAGELLPVAREPLGGAAALCGGVAAPAARAEVHRRDQLEPGRKDDTAGG